MATGQGLAVATYLAVLTTALAYLLYARGVRTAVTTATTLGLAEPAVAAVFGLTVLGERLTITGLAGLGVLAVGLVIAAWPAWCATAAATSDRALGQPQKGATQRASHRRRAADEDRSGGRAAVIAAFAARGSALTCSQSSTCRRGSPSGRRRGRGQPGAR